jgi:hypothetical protein
MGFEGGAGQTIDSGKTPDGRRGVAMADWFALGPCHPATRFEPDLIAI